MIRRILSLLILLISTLSVFSQTYPSDIKVKSFAIGTTKVTGINTAVVNNADTASNAKLLTEGAVFSYIKIKLAGITPGPTNLGLGSLSPTSLPVTNSNGTGFTIPIAVAGTTAGLQSASDKAFSDSIRNKLLKDTSYSANAGSAGFAIFYVDHDTIKFRKMSILGSAVLSLLADSGLQLDTRPLVPATRILTINGVAQDFTQDRSFTTPGTIITVFGRSTSAISATAGDYTANKVTNAVDSTVRYSDPAWITAINFAKVIGLTGNVSILDIKATGTKDGSHFLAGDSTWKTVPTAGGIGIRTANSQSGTTYTLALADTSKYLLMTNAASNTISIPDDATLSLTIGCTIEVYQQGLGTTVVAPLNGNVTVNSPGGRFKTVEQYSKIILHKVSANSWILSGDLSL